MKSMQTLSWKRAMRRRISGMLKAMNAPDPPPPLYGALDVKRFPSRFSDIAYPYVRSTGPSLRPDHERGRTRGWAEVKDGPQGHRRRRRPASLRSAHPRVTLGGLGSDDWPAWWVSRSKAEFPRPWTAARSNNLVFGPARGRRCVMRIGCEAPGRVGPFFCSACGP